MLSFIKKVLIILVFICIGLIFIEIYQENPKEKPRTKNHRKFVASCISHNASDAVCDCMYREFQYQFGDAYLHKLSKHDTDRKTNTAIKLIKKRCEHRVRLNSTQSTRPMLKYHNEQ